MSRGMQEGSWVLLTNAHLAPRPWLNALVQRIAPSASPTSTPSPLAFRLILAVEIRSSPVPAGLPPHAWPACVLPPSLVRACVPVVMEAPAGLRAALSRALSCVPSPPPSLSASPLGGGDYWSGGARSGASTGAGAAAAASAALLRCWRVYARVCWLHASLAERARYGTRGSEVGLEEVTDADLACAISTADGVLAKMTPVLLSSTPGGSEWAGGGGGGGGGDASMLELVSRLLCSAVYSSRLPANGVRPAAPALSAAATPSSTTPSPPSMAALWELAGSVFGERSDGDGGGASDLLRLADTCLLDSSSSSGGGGVGMREALVEWACDSVPLHAPPSWLGLLDGAEATKRAAEGVALLRTWGGVPQAM